MELDNCLKVLKYLNTNLQDAVSHPEYDKVFSLIHNIHFKKKKHENKIHRENYRSIMYSSGTCRNRLNSGIKLQNMLDGKNLKPVPLPLLPPSGQVVNHSAYPISCHICKKKFTEIHHHYYSLCPSCARFNFAQRQVTGDLSSKVSLVTGGRVKIGFEIVKKLLRSGSRVIATTRFPEDALRRYEIEEDYEDWKHNLTIVYLDLINYNQVREFVKWVETKFGRLDILILNAAQTVSREPVFYDRVRQNYDECDHFIEASNRGRLYEGNGTGFNSLDFGASGFLTGLANDNLPIVAKNEYENLQLQLDEDHQIKEYRASNSWTERLDNFSNKDFLAILIINLFSPACLVQMLTPLMKRSGEEFSFVILVSAVEGMFKINTKTSGHPHTNAAKAGLNMLTRTSGADYRNRFNILINSVDTGFVTVETQNTTNFVPPLDNLDGMARVLHPIFEWVNYRKLIYGKMMKNFKCVDF